MKILMRIWLDFSKHKFRHCFKDALNALVSWSNESEKVTRCSIKQEQEN